jgi:hypothetical protein
MGSDEDAAPRYRWSVRDAFSYDDFAAPMIRRTILEWETIGYRQRRR